MADATRVHSADGKASGITHQTLTMLSTQWHLSKKGEGGGVATWCKTYLVTNKDLL